MYSPRAIHRPPSAKPPPFSKGNHTALPKKSADVMKVLRNLENRIGRLNSVDSNDEKGALSASDVGVARTEAIERKLMQLEDYTFTEEGRRRVERMEEEHQMILEDLLSTQVREEINMIEFKKRIRAEAAERQRLEAMEREKRKKVAEERRRAVVARIRKAEEDERRRIYEAEQARLRIIEGKERARQLLINRLRADRSAMALEDQLSRLAEEQREEDEARRTFLKMEAAKLDEWERMQKEKDKIEASERAERLRILQQKKAKLQALGAAVPQRPAAEVSAAMVKEQADRLNKQLRIQNKAKFVSKRIKAGGTSNDAVSEVTNNCDAGSSDLGDVKPRGTLKSIQRDLVPVDEADLCDDMEEKDDDASSLQVFLQRLSKIFSEKELRDLQKDLMAEKRKLRLEQRQRPSGGGAAAAQALKELRKKIKLVGTKEEAVQKRIDELVNQGGRGAGGGNADIGGEAETIEIHAANASTAVDISRPVTPAKAAHNNSQEVRRGSRSAVGGPSESVGARIEIALSKSASLSTLAIEDKFKAAEALISESAEVTKLLQFSGDSLRRPMSPTFIATQQRKAALLVMKMQDLMNNIPADQDVANFQDRLKASSTQLVTVVKSSEAILPLSSTASPSKVAPVATDTEALSAQAEVALVKFVATHGTEEEQLKVMKQLLAESAELEKLLASAATMDSGTANQAAYAAQLRRASVVATKLEDMIQAASTAPHQAELKDRLAAATEHLVSTVKAAVAEHPHSAGEVSSATMDKLDSAAQEAEVAQMKFLARHGTVEDRLQVAEKLIATSVSLAAELNASSAPGSDVQNVDLVQVASKQHRGALLLSQIEELMKSIPAGSDQYGLKEKLETVGVHLATAVVHSESIAPLVATSSTAGTHDTPVEVSVAHFIACHGKEEDKLQMAEQLVRESVELAGEIKQSISSASSHSKSPEDSAADVATKQHRAALIVTKIENLLKAIPVGQEDTLGLVDKLSVAGVYLASLTNQSQVLIPGKNSSSEVAKDELMLSKFLTQHGTPADKLRAAEELVTESAELAKALQAASSSSSSPSSDTHMIESQQRRASVLASKIQDLLKSMPPGQDATAVKERLLSASAHLANSVKQSEQMALSSSAVSQSNQGNAPLMDVFQGSPEDRLKVAEELVSQSVELAKLLNATSAAGATADTASIVTLQRQAALLAMKLQDVMKRTPPGQDISGFKDLLTATSAHLVDAVQRSENIVPLSQATITGAEINAQAEMALAKFVALYGTSDDRVRTVEQVVAEAAELAKQLVECTVSPQGEGVVASKQIRAAQLEIKIQDMMTSIPADQDTTRCKELLCATSAALIDAVAKSESVAPLFAAKSAIMGANNSHTSPPMDPQVQVMMARFIAQHGTLEDRLQVAEQLVAETTELTRALESSTADPIGGVTGGSDRLVAQQKQAAVLEMRVQELLRSIPQSQDLDGVKQRLNMANARLVDAVKQSETAAPLGFVQVDVVGLSPRERDPKSGRPLPVGPHPNGATIHAIMKPSPPLSPPPRTSSAVAAVASDDKGAAFSRATTPHTRPPTSSGLLNSRNGDVSTGLQFYKTAEQLMTDAAEVTKSLEKAARAGKTQDDDFFARNPIATHKRNATLLRMKMTEVMKSIKEEDDVTGFRDRLQAMCDRVENVVSGNYAASLPPDGVGPQRMRSYSMDSTGSNRVTAKESSTAVIGLPASGELDDRGSDGKAGGHDGANVGDEDMGEVVADAEESDSDFGTESFEDVPGWEECINTTMATAAHHAAFYGYLGVIELLARYFDCFVLDEKGRTPLFYASLQNRLDVVAFLVRLDPQWIDVGDSRGDTALHAAAVSSVSSNAEVLRFLLSCEASPDIANFEGLTPCHLAKTELALRCLCDAGAVAYCVDNRSRTPLYVACAEGRLECVKFLCNVTPAEFTLWCDNDGDSCLHIAARNGHHECVEALCDALTGVDDLNTPNKKDHTPAHVASTALVLQKLYENGADMWITDAKGRYPLFVAAFLGRVDCVSFLLELANGKASQAKDTKQKSSGSKTQRDNIAELVGAKDKQGDTALHAACLCGHIQCAMLLVYFLRCTTNVQGLSPDQLAARAGHLHLTRIMQHVEKMKAQGHSSESVFGCSFEDLSAVTLYYGSRWAKLYDCNANSIYYFDRVMGTSQWERPVTYDESPKDEARTDKAREVLQKFYSRYNPSKLKDMNEILAAFRHNYTELFISLVERYQVEDLSMFAGVKLD